MNFFNKFDKLKVKYKDNPGVKISFLLGIISILFIFVGGSYAFIFKSVYTESINTISAGSLVITLENTTPVISVNNAIPTPDDVALSDSTTYDFTLKNTGSINAKYKLSLINSCTVGSSYTVGDSSVKADVCIPAQYVKAGISKDGEDFKVVKVDSDGNIILDNGVIGKSRSSSYKLKLWLDYDTPNSYNVKNKNTVMSYKIQLYSEQTTEGKLDTSGANAPSLTSNMIPVYYDEIRNVWKKADSTNSNHLYKWYNYEDKMWANAVTVTSKNRDTYLKASAGTTIPMSDINTMWVWVPRYTYTMLNTCANIKNPTESANPKCYGYVYKDAYHDDLVNDLVSNGWVSDETEAEEVITAWKNGEVDESYTGETFESFADPSNGYTELTFDKSFISTNVGEQSFDIKFESGTQSTGTIKCTDAVTGTSSTSETCTDTKNGGVKAGTSTYTHPAFWWDKNDNNVREKNEELTGIWVGKFEVSSDTSCTPSYSVAVGSGCNLQTIRPRILPNVTSWRGAQVGTFFNGIQKMRESGNKYGFSTTDETHMMKNMEWGAVTYLSHSKYGINKEVAINSANTFTTGCGPQSAGSTSEGSTCNSYTTTLGQSASTTGNVYGVYDMSGGSWEYMMGNMVWSNGQQMSGNTTTNNYNSAFTGILYGSGKGTAFTGTYSFPSKRYYDKYSYGTSNTEYTRGKLGDATKEMAPTGTSGNWYGDYAYFPVGSVPWFFRGGTYGAGAIAGAFNFNYSDGRAYTNSSARAVLLGALD